MKKRKYLWALALTGMLMVGNVSIVAHAASINAGVNIANDANPGAGDALNIGVDGAPAADAPAANALEADAPAVNAPEEVNIPEADVPAASAPEQGNQEISSIQDEEIPLAVLTEGGKTETGILGTPVVIGAAAAVGFMFFLLAGRKKKAEKQ